MLERTESKLAVKNNCQGIYIRQHIPTGFLFTFTNISRTYLRVLGYTAVLVHKPMLSFVR